ncbi:MAG: hypothetical protein IT195_11010 [Microthrixaceae bacterium]|nr:hypothetical protein [Microthrixaceae bacterium]
MHPNLRRAVIVVILGFVGYLLWYVNGNAVTGDQSTSMSKPSYVLRLIPASGASVPVQDRVGIDLSSGFDAYLDLNGIEIRNVVEDPTADGLVRSGTGTIGYQPAVGHRVERLASGENCVTAFVWKQEEGRDTAKPLRWCFTAT